ncbi:MAG TPA: hypothetical protein VKW78_17235 [Terriglobales bacterium]|nr:hypothetical protein [Terriglobales bacterium]
MHFAKHKAAFLVILLVSACWVPLRAQSSPFPGDQLPGASDPSAPISPEQQRMERERQKRMNTERFESLKRDTDKLLELATELKQNVDRANENTLSLDVIKKTDEIDKLAKQIRDKMKGQ